MIEKKNLPIGFIVYDNEGRILRTGSCIQSDLEVQAQSEEFVMIGIANDLVQKIVGGKVINKTSEEIAADTPPDTPYEQQRAYIINGQLQEILDRLTQLEMK